MCVCECAHGPALSLLGVRNPRNHRTLLLAFSSGANPPVFRNRSSFVAGGATTTAMPASTPTDPAATTNTTPTTTVANATPGDEDPFLELQLVDGKPVLKPAVPDGTKRKKRRNVCSLSCASCVC